MKKYEYTILDNKSNAYKKEFINDSEAISYLKKNWKNYIVSALSRDKIWLCDPEKYILATVDTASGYLEVQSWNKEKK